MCQRYVLPEQAAAEREFLPAKAWWKFAVRFNVAPEQYVPAIRVHDGQTEGVLLRWGVIPSWLEGEPVGQPKTRVHANRLDRSKSCGSAWSQGRRCILPMAGFYSWQLASEGHRQPFFVHLTERSVFGVAGVWDRWVSEEDDVIESCAIVTVPANELVSDIAGPLPAMPGILRRRDYEAWLRGSVDQARAALQTYKAQWMHAYPVSPRINSTAVDDPSLIHAAG